MTKEVFLEKFIDILDTESEIDINTDLSDIEEWDSLSIVSFGGIVHVETGKKADMEKIKAAKTVGDLFDIVK